MLSTKARRVSVGARAGNARRSALRPRMRGAVPNVGREGLAGSSGARPGGTRNACPRGRSPTRGESGCRRPEIRSRRTFCRRPGACLFRVAGARERHCRRTRRPALRLRECLRAGPALFRGTGKTRTPMPGDSLRPGAGTHARGAIRSARRSGARPGARAGSCPADRGKQRREPPAFRAARGATGGSVQGADAGEPAFAAGLGPGRQVPQDSAGRCGSGNADALGFPVPGNRESSPGVRGQGPEEPGTHTRGARDAKAGAAAPKNRSPRTARKESKPTKKRRSRLPCPGTFRKRNTLP